MRVIIAGSRECTDYRLVVQAIEASGLDVTTVVCGMCRGVDLLGRRWAQERGVHVDEYHARWDAHGRSAGPRRNREMARNADALILIWDGASRGSASMLRMARAAGLRIYETVVRRA